MAKRRQGEQRPIRPDLLERFAGAHLLPRLLPGRRVWRYKVTVLPSSAGYGLRDPGHPEQEPECNYNAYFVVLALPGAAADRYFRALRTELQDALDEGVILVERQVVWIP